MNIKSAEIRISLYSPQNFETCREVFLSNTPKFFGKHEVKDFEYFLNNQVDENFWCLFYNERVVACGGFYLKNEDTGRLCYGIVHNDFHKRGIGRHLAYFRLKKLVQISTVKKIEIGTSQFNPAFFNKFGFELIESIEDGYGKGINRCNMQLNLTNTLRRKIINY